jgi:flagellin
MINMYNLLERLSSGLRINRAADDPAGLVISEQLRSQIASLNQQIENISMQIGKYETASSTVLNLRTDLNELRDLALGASDEGLTDEAARGAYDESARALVSSYNRTVETAAYNNVALLDGSEGSLATLLPLSEIDLSTTEAAAQSVEEIDRAVDQVDDALVTIGSRQRYDLESHQASLEISRQNLISAESQIRDADFGETMSLFIGSMIREKAGLALLAHARLTASTVLSLFDS